MSMEVYIFTKKEKIPSAVALQEAIRGAGFDYTLAEGFDPHSEEFGFWMGDFEGLESGCDYVVEAYEEDDWSFEDEERALIGDADSVIVLGTFSNAQEIAAMASISSVLTWMTGGVMVSNFFWEKPVGAYEAIGEAVKIIENSREQFNGPSTIRSSVLSSGDNEVEDDAMDPEAMDRFVRELQDSLQEKIDSAFAQKIGNGLTHSDGYNDGDGFADEVRSALDGAGIDLGRATDLAFYLYLPDQKSAEEARGQITATGLKCHIEEDGYTGSRWLCYSARKMIPTHDTLSAVGDLMLRLASELDGEFDGWETVPEFGFNPFAGEYDEADCELMAADILQNTRALYTPPHEFVPVVPEKFDTLDLEGYDTLQKEFEAMGYTMLADIENKTVSDMGQIVTFSRAMYHPGIMTVGMFYYFEMFSLFFFEFVTELSDGRLVITTNAIPGDEAGMPESIDTLYMQFATHMELLNVHLERVESYLNDSTLHAVALDTIEKIIEMENEAVMRKYEKIRSIGWVSREFLLASSGGDENLSDCIYGALQRLLAEEEQRG